MPLDTMRERVFLPMCTIFVPVSACPTPLPVLTLQKHNHLDIVLCNYKNSIVFEMYIASRS